MGVKIRFWKEAWWVFINHAGKRKSKRIGDKASATRVAQAIRERIAKGDLQLEQTNPETLAVYADAWQTGLSKALKASTLRFYGDNLRRYILPALGSRPISSINRRDCRELVASLRLRSLKINTVRGIARTLSAVLSQAVEDEKLPANPALRLGKYLRPGDEEATEIQPLDAAQAALLVATAERHFGRWYPWVLCALRTGMRLGELIALQWGDIDWNERFITVQRNIVKGTLTTPKSHQRRRVDMTPQLAESLLAWRRR
jgi:integrase